MLAQAGEEPTEERVRELSSNSVALARACISHEKALIELRKDIVRRAGRSQATAITVAIVGALVSGALFVGVSEALGAFAALATAVIIPIATALVNGVRHFQRALQEIARGILGDASG